LCRSSSQRAPAAPWQYRPKHFEGKVKGSDQLTEKQGENELEMADEEELANKCSAYKIANRIAHR
jgi:hypothetical protein